MKTLLLILGLIAITVVVVESGRNAKRRHNCSTHFKGCKLERGECMCGRAIDCENPYPYKDLEECTADLKGLSDKCKDEPCTHGRCVQAKRHGKRKWICSCAGSGFYGRRCQHKCPPTDKQSSLPINYPSDCIY